jgi:hypothetical protein
MRFARLFTPLVLATALVAPATMSAAHAADNAITMSITTGKVVTPAVNVVKRTEKQSFQNLDVLAAHAVKVEDFASGTFFETSPSLHAYNPAQPLQIAKASLAPWQQTNAPLGLYKVIVDGSLQAVITVIDG